MTIIHALPSRNREWIIRQANNGNEPAKNQSWHPGRGTPGGLFGLDAGTTFPEAVDLREKNFSADRLYLLW
jgi:hypothetical protein